MAAPARFAGRLGGVAPPGRGDKRGAAGSPRWGRAGRSGRGTDRASHRPHQSSSRTRYREIASSLQCLASLELWLLPPVITTCLSLSFVEDTGTGGLSADARSQRAPVPVAVPAPVPVPILGTLLVVSTVDNHLHGSWIAATTTRRCAQPGPPNRTGKRSRIGHTFPGHWCACSGPPWRAGPSTPSPPGRCAPKTPHAPWRQSRGWLVDQQGRYVLHWHIRCRPERWVNADAVAQGQYPQALAFTLRRPFQGGRSMVLAGVSHGCHRIGSLGLASRADLDVLGRYGPVSAVPKVVAESC